jgi:2-polyprenyl-3-methyl-5-hydroxy-6-metoxy-1,4-benzoquinol methylase
LQYETERIDCPICGPSDQVPLYIVDGWNIVRCVSCRLAMINPRRKHAIEIYKDDAYFKDANYYYDYEGNKKAYQKGFRSKLKLITKYHPQRGKLLDVGAAYGFFMEEATRFGFQSFGVELSRGAAERAASYGEVFNQPLSEVHTNHRFAVIAFVDSLEHFDYPVNGLQKAWELLEDHGIVAVMVPNIDSWFARLAKTNWHLLLPEEHLFYFTPNSLRLMLEKAGFDVLHMGTGGYGRSLAEILRVLARGRHIHFGAAENMLRNITFEINLGDIFAIAQKPPGSVSAEKRGTQDQAPGKTAQAQTTARS